MILYRPNDPTPHYFSAGQPTALGVWSESVANPPEVLGKPLPAEDAKPAGARLERESPAKADDTKARGRATEMPKIEPVATGENRSQNPKLRTLAWRFNSIVWPNCTRFRNEHEKRDEEYQFPRLDRIEKANSIGLSVAKDEEMTAILSILDVSRCKMSEWNNYLIEANKYSVSTELQKIESQAQLLAKIMENLSDELSNVAKCPQGRSEESGAFSCDEDSSELAVYSINPIKPSAKKVFYQIQAEASAVAGEASRTYDAVSGFGLKQRALKVQQTANIINQNIGR